MLRSPRPFWSSRVFRCLPAVLWAVFIFVMSAQSASVSGTNSAGIVEPVVAFVAQVSGNPALSREAPGYDLLLEHIDSIFREAMHAAEYLVLGALTAFASTAFPLKRRAGVAFAICVAYSLSDETHQLFVPGRAFQLLDLALDALGSALGVWVVMTAMRLRARRVRRSPRVDTVANATGEASA